METVKKRRRVVVDESALAEAIGARIKQARLAAGLTQAQLAGDRYTKAYVSALEHGLAKPSMAALTFLSERLGVESSGGMVRIGCAHYNTLSEIDRLLEAIETL